MTAWAALLALLAALLFAVASVAQQSAATEVPDEGAGAMRLMLHLVRSPLWWAGFVGDTGSFAAQAAALALGSLLLVQPLLVTALLFALPLGAAWRGRRLTAADWGWASLLSVSLAAFVVVADPSSGHDKAAVHSWLKVAALLVPLVAGCLLGAQRSRRSRAVLLAIATGVLYGVSAALTKSVMNLLGAGLVPLLTGWETYALVLAGTAGTLLQQSAFQAGNLKASMPAVTVLEPVVAVTLGVTILGEQVRVDGLTWTVLAAAVLGMLVGTVMLSLSSATAVPAPVPEPVTP